MEIPLAEVTQGTVSVTINDTLSPPAQVAEK
jgi:hypothetical protein